MKYQIKSPTNTQTIEAIDIHMAVNKAKSMAYVMGCDLIVKSVLSGATYRVKCPKSQPVR